MTGGWWPIEFGGSWWGLTYDQLTNIKFSISDAVVEQAGDEIELIFSATPEWITNDKTGLKFYPSFSTLSFSFEYDPSYLELMSVEVIESEDPSGQDSHVGEHSLLRYKEEGGRVYVAIVSKDKYENKTYGPQPEGNGESAFMKVRFRAISELTSPLEVDIGGGYNIELGGQGEVIGGESGYVMIGDTGYARGQTYGYEVEDVGKIMPPGSLVEEFTVGGRSSRWKTSRWSALSSAIRVDKAITLHEFKQYIKMTVDSEQRAVIKKWKGTGQPRNTTNWEVILDKDLGMQSGGTKAQWYTSGEIKVELEPGWYWCTIYIPKGVSMTWYRSSNREKNTFEWGLAKSNYIRDRNYPATSRLNYRNMNDSRLMHMKYYVSGE